MQSQYFSNFDEFAGSVGGVDATMMMVNPTKRAWTIHKADLAEIHVELGFLSSGNIVEGQMRADGYFVYIPLSDRTHYAVDGMSLAEDKLGVLEPSCEFCVATKAAHDWGSIFVPVSLIASDAQGADPARTVDAIAARTVRTSPEIASRLRALVQRVVAASISCPEIESSPAARSAKADLLAERANRSKAADGRRCCDTRSSAAPAICSTGAKASPCSCRIWPPPPASRSPRSAPPSTRSSASARSAICNCGSFIRSS